MNNSWLSSIDEKDLILNHAELGLIDETKIVDTDSVYHLVSELTPTPLSGQHSKEEYKYWLAVKSELNILICSDDKKYDELRKRLNSVNPEKPIAVLVSAGLAPVIGVSAGALAGLVSIAIFALMKIGINAFCSMGTATDK